MPHQTQQFETQLTARLNYLLHRPPAAERDGSQRWPLILFLHGAGERGHDLEQLKKYGIPQIVEQQPDFPFITVSPQCPPEEWWPAKIELLRHLLDEIVASQPVDPRRIYLTGLSMGGYGSWSLAVTEPERFAAVVPICGGGLSILGFPEKVCLLKKTPIWAFHGAQDEVVALNESKILVNTLKACGGNVRFTVYPKAGHDSWTETYANPALYEWLLAQQK